MFTFSMFKKIKYYDCHDNLKCIKLIKWRLFPRQITRYSPQLLEKYKIPIL